MTDFIPRNYLAALIRTLGADRALDAVLDGAPGGHVLLIGDQPFPPRPPEPPTKGAPQ